MVAAWHEVDFFLCAVTMLLDPRLRVTWESPESMLWFGAFAGDIPRLACMPSEDWTRFALGCQQAADEQRVVTVEYAIGTAVLTPTGQGLAHEWTWTREGPDLYLARLVHQATLDALRARPQLARDPRALRQFQAQVTVEMRALRALLPHGQELPSAVPERR